MALFTAGLIIGAIAGGTLAALVACCCQAAHDSGKIKRGANVPEQHHVPPMPMVLTDERDVVRFTEQDEIVFFDEWVDTEKLEESLFEALANDLGKKLLQHGALIKRDNGPLTPGKRFECSVEAQVVMPEKARVCEE